MIVFVRHEGYIVQAGICLEGFTEKVRLSTAARLLPSRPEHRTSPPTDGTRVYQALLTRKYLTTKIMPLLAIAAVTLSVATVLVTWSVMGGFLNTLLTSGRSMIGDVSIYWPNVGFPYYDDLCERLEKDPRIKAACPIIESFGVIALPDDQVHGVMVKG
ncbi:MAG TPA: hypothetical protein ENK11_06595, partial [Phycisphaerales bacterium]|nr:hypothetical protein [Phycisphaerales bacterium]